jgi:hypothetical protein
MDTRTKLVEACLHSGLPHGGRREFWSVESSVGLDRRAVDMVVAANSLKFEGCEGV